MAQENLNDSPGPGKENIVSENWELIAEAGWLVGQHFPILGHIILGRDSSCDIIIPGTHLSRQHAELVCKGSKLLIRDLDSSNGTYVNEKRVTEAELNSGDMVRFDVLTFRVQAPSTVKDANATMIRRVPKPKKDIATAKSTPKPSARHSTDHTTKHSDKKVKQTRSVHLDQISHPKQTAEPTKSRFSIMNLIAAVLTIAIIASIGYLISQL